MHDYDLFDVLAFIAFGVQPRTRAERSEAFMANSRQWLEPMPDQTRNTILAIVSQFGKGGIENLEHSGMLSTPEVEDAGGGKALSGYPHGDAREALQDIKRRIFGG